MKDFILECLCKETTCPKCGHTGMSHALKDNPSSEALNDMVEDMSVVVCPHCAHRMLSTTVIRGLTPKRETG